MLPPLVLPWTLDRLPPTPFYYYDGAVAVALLKGFHRALKAEKADVKLHFAVKANNNPHLLKLFLKSGCGVDIVSGGELRLSLRAGFRPGQVIFSGVGKTQAELELAVKSGVFLVNVESAFEIDMLETACARLRKRARISFRVNPDVDAKTHKYIATGLYEHKFGLSFEEALPLYQRARASKWLDVKGIGIHIGSQLLDLRPLDEALEKTIALARELKARGISLENLDVGGGLGIDYDDPRATPPFDEYARILGRASRAWKQLQGPKASLHSECGRALVGPAGWLVTRVIGIKRNPRKAFAVVDASMSELLRPALYGARHPVLGLTIAGKRGLTPEPRPESVFEIVGPVCESSDVLHPEARLTTALAAGDPLVIGCAGAYGFTMASHYNVRSMPAEYFGQPKGGRPILSRKSRPF